MTTTLLCCLLLLRGRSANGGKWRADWLLKDISSEVVGHHKLANNCEPKKKREKKAQPHFRIIVSLYKKKTASHTLTHAHTDISSHAQTLAHTQTSLNLSDTHTYTCAQNTQTSTNAVAQTQSKCPRKVDELHSVSNWKHLQSQFLSAVEACISRQKRLLGVPGWLA